MSTAVTYLFVPGDRPERFDKAAAAGPDVMILDLEDAVHPDAKPAARAAIAAWLAGRPDANAFVRINDSASPAFAADLAWLRGLPAGTALAGLLVPKAEDAAALRTIAQALQAINPQGELVAIIETALGLHQVDAVASAGGVARLAFGSLDYAVDLGCSHSRDALAFARARIVLASRVAGLPPPVDGVTTALKDEAVLAGDVAYARELGFAGKLCIHPAQLGAVRAGFLPSAEQLDWARRVLDATASGSHAVQVDGKMVDRPVIEQARRLLALAQ
ncbi:CoA ester lyase [Cupriavidus taiwanensis]|uniref:Putative HpcH/HpaI aldolase/citrate lyase family n=1 Tax=Cupriavidus taiwanensis TaxID=164546 RepID=A0A375ILP7_9BURK|nr:CoA ester lyase [Cupriavidus taiwanensis]SOZ30667.1 putative HpcH/HpaI aldolase/citrate lyase family [Cupriavidus taiwanensis]SPA35298.1 putative HpcH/HpaI aldolase/citrate lyase family [Cupriavidus taiwanensis]SPK75596.1 putative HpcH/HpaI aldolase/citrate lyase family [Cupriavidus taiwanensis]